MKHLVHLFVFTTVSLTVDAFASEQYRPSPELAKRFAKLRAQRTEPMRRDTSFSTTKGDLIFAVGRLEVAADGMLLVSVPITRTMKKALVANGVRVVHDQSRIAQDTIYRRRLFRVFAVAPDVRDDGYFASKVGRRVKLELRRTVHGRHVVTGFR